MLVNDIINSLRDTPDVWKFQPNMWTNYIRHMYEDITVIPKAAQINTADRGIVYLGFWDAYRVSKAVRQWQMRKLKITEVKTDASDCL